MGFYFLTKTFLSRELYSDLERKELQERGLLVHLLQVGMG